MASARQHGTMYQLKNVVNRTNVKNPKTNFNACDDFFQIIVTSHILAAAMEVLGMSNLDDTPCEDVLLSPDLIWMDTDEVRKGFLQDITMLIAKRFIGISYNTPLNASTSDGVNDYSRHLLTIGCLYAEMRDAVERGRWKSRLAVLTIPITSFSPCWSSELHH